MMVLAADCDGDFEICTWGLQDSVSKTYTNYDFENLEYFILLLVEVSYSDAHILQGEI